MKQLRKVLILLTLVSICSSSLAYAEPERPEVRRPTEGTGEMDKLPDKDKDKDKDKNNNTSGGLKAHNGKERKESELYVDSGAPSSFKGAKYYDSTVPYELTYNEVGGCSIEGTVPKEGTGGLLVMSDSVRQSKIGGRVAQMGSSGFTVGMRWGGGDRDGLQFDHSKVTYGYEGGTNARILTDNNGVKYYLIAIQAYHYNSSGSYYPFDVSSLGQVVDIILTDGTVIHTVVSEHNAIEHTNGIKNGEQGESSYTSFDGTMVVDKLKMSQYKNLFQACNGCQIELMEGGASAFTEKYNLGSGEGKNRIMYYRMYNFKADNAPKPASNDVKELSYKIPVDGELVGGGNPSNNDKEVTDLEQLGLYDETHYVKWKSDKEWLAYFPNWQEMHNEDISDVENWKADLEKKNDESILIKGGRWLTILFGIIFEVWMLLIYISYWFDRLNNFFDYSLLNLVTFGRLSISPDEDECTFSLTSLGKHEKRTVNHRKVLEVVIIGLAFGTLIVSGVFFSILSSVVNKILEILY